jgi:two-component system, OmpR family, phosphate regulon sensor histidine kinase PhoR
MTSDPGLTRSGEKLPGLTKPPNAARRVARNVAHLMARTARSASSFIAARLDPNPPLPVGRESVQRYRETVAWQTIVDALPTPAIALDANGIVRHHNAAATAIYPTLESGQPISHVSRNPALLNAVDQLSEATQAITIELIERLPFERRFTATLASVAPREIAPGLPQALVTFRDTTEQDKLVQMRTDFIANASHELRTPLSAMRGFIETLQGPARDDPKARERFLGIMATQAERMTRLIDDLLSLSRAEMRAHLPPQGVVDLNEVTASVVQTLKNLVQTANATVDFTPLPSPALIRGEREEMTQVLHNLIQNAIKYGRDGGHVTIALTAVPPRALHLGERLSLTVSDDGPGIAPEHLPRLTERFYRAHVSASREKGGTGLGLAIVKHIVHRHRGLLDIESTLGKGSVFTVSFDRLVDAA